MEGYKTIKNECSAEIEVKRSKFIATLCHVETENEATEFINRQRKKYWDAKHNVYAFIIRQNGTKRFSDDGEPHSTAGLPVTEVIEGFGITDVAAVVTRYFGGILLGTGGLVRAYSEAVSEALKSAEVVTVLPAKRFKIICDYTQFDVLSKVLNDNKAKIISTDFSDKIEVSAAIPSTDFDNLKAKCVDVFCGKIAFSDIEEIFLGF